MAAKKAIQGLVALVTGGASGFGEATARRLIQQGASVVICDLPTSKGNELATKLGERCAFAPANITSEEEMQGALRMVKQKFTQLDVVVNCTEVGLMNKTYDFAKDQPPSLKDITQVLNTHTVGTFNVVRLAAGLMGKNKFDDDGQKGVIINTCSSTALKGVAGHLAMATSGGGIVGLTLPLARDLECQGIRSCTIATGLFNTPLVQSLSEQDREELVEKLPLSKKIWEPDHYAHMVQCIIETRFLNGCVIQLGAPLQQSKPYYCGEREYLTP